MAKAGRKAQKASTRRDGRKAMLIYMRPEIIEAAKGAALAGDMMAWQFVERAVEKALKSKAKAATPVPARGPPPD